MLHSDSFEINVCSESREHFDEVMRIVLHEPHVDPRYSDPEVEGYVLDPEKGMILLWSLDKDRQDQVKLPYKMDYEAACDFVWHWLESFDYSKIKREDHDGDDEKGWRVYTINDWGEFQYCAIVAIKPEWMVYSK